MEGCEVNGEGMPAQGERPDEGESVPPPRSRRDPISAVLCGGAALLHAMSIAFVLLILKIGVERSLSEPISWDLFFRVLSDTGRLAPVVEMAAGQGALAVGTGIAGLLLFRNRTRPAAFPAALCVALGIVGILYSLLVFGGVFGAMGGVLALSCGLRAVWIRQSASAGQPTLWAVVEPERARPAIAKASATEASAILLIFAAVLHVAAIPIGLYALKVLVEAAAHRAVSWPELFRAAGAANLLGLLVVAVVGQADFAFIATAGAMLASRGRRGAGGPMVCAGALAIIISLLVFGGITGALGGVLSILGGALYLQHSLSRTRSVRPPPGEPAGGGTPYGPLPPPPSSPPPSGP